MPSVDEKRPRKYVKAEKGGKVEKAVFRRIRMNFSAGKKADEAQAKRVSERSTKAKSVGISVQFRQLLTGQIITEEPSELDLPVKKIPKLKLKFPPTGNTTIPVSPVREIPSQVVDPVCPICRQIISGDINDVNLHIDGCLEPASESDIESGPEISSRVNKETEDIVSLDADSLPTATVNIEGEESRYGAPQYTIQDVHRIIREARKSFHKCGRDEDWKQVTEIDSRETLLERIKRLDAKLESSARCLICLDSFVNPVVSTVCWHVCCEVCWCQTLGSKRLCPQCNRITSPDDLRRIYF